MVWQVAKLSTLLVLFVACTAVTVCAQPDFFPDASSRSPGRQPHTEKPAGLDEMKAKQQAERTRKAHEKMLERGEQALTLANQLEASFAQNKQVSSQDRARLDSLEEIVMKIREELGGDDDDGADASEASKAADEGKPSNVEEAFKYLHSTTVKLVDELKKTTRFSISAVAIQSSNTVIKIVKFLRLRK